MIVDNIRLGDADIEQDREALARVYDLLVDKLTASLHKVQDRVM